MILKENNSQVAANRSEILNRIDLPYQNLSNKFQYGSKDFTRQFAHIYAGRLNVFKLKLLKKAKNKWGNDIPVHILSELADDEFKKCVIIGTLYKEQRMKPSLLKEISEEHQLVPQPAATHYTSPDDFLILEDETQRIRLEGGPAVTTIATGVAIALLGKENDSGKFQVEDYCFAGVESVQRPLDSNVSNDCFIILASGLELGSNADLLSIKLVVDWVTGICGGPGDQSHASKVARVILAGNSVGAPPPGEMAQVGDIGGSSVVAAVKLLDDVLQEFVASVPVDIMPGEFDPANHTLPQQPLHPCLLPNAAKMDSLKVVSNPYQMSVGGRLAMGTAGQPINDLSRVTDGVDPLELLTKTLAWGHLAPTAPDTLACYPYYKTDPFIIDELPDIYFAGNQPAYQSSLFPHESGRSVRLVCIPSFAQTKQCVLVNLRNLDCSPVSFT